MEICNAGGVEDGVDNSSAAKEELVSAPEDAFKVTSCLIQPSYIAAALALRAKRILIMSSWFV